MLNQDIKVCIAIGTYTNDFDTTLSYEIVMKLYLTIPIHIHRFFLWRNTLVHISKSCQILDTFQPDIKFVNNHLTFIFVLLINTSMKFGSPLLNLFVTSKNETTNSPIHQFTNFKCCKMSFKAF